MNGDLFEVRCPAKLTTKSGYEIRCDHLCCIAARGSVIQIKCRHCKNTFEAYIPEDAKTSRDVAFKML